jgi:hypothetical protein
LVVSSLQVRAGSRAGRAPFALVLCASLVAAPAGAGDLRVLLEAEAGVRSDGNYTQTAQVDAPGLDQDEDLARAGFNLHLSYELPRWNLALGYSPSYEWTLGTDTSAHGTTHRLDLGLTGNLTRRLEMRARERLLSSPGLDLYAPFTQVETIAVTRRGDQLTHSFDLALDQELTRRTSLLLGATHTLRTFESGDLSDTETLSARVGAGFDLAEDRRVDALATIGYYDFGEDRRTLPGTRGRNREADVQTLGVAYQQPVWRDGRFRVEAGLFSVSSTRVVLVASPQGTSPEDEVVREEDERNTGWRGVLELSRQRELFGWNLAYRHDVSAGVGLGRPTEVDDAFAGVSVRLGRRLILGLDGNASRHQDLSDNGNVSDGPVLTEADRHRLVESVAGTARLSWNFSTVARLHGGYSRIWQESRVEPFEDLSYARYFLGLAVQLYRSGEEPLDPARQGEPEDDQPDTR